MLQQLGVQGQIGTVVGRARARFSLAVTPGYVRARREGRGVQGRPPHRHAKRSERTTAGSHALSKKLLPVDWCV